MCFANREEWTKEPQAYRISDEKLKQVDELLSVYHGTKCYHNFTSGKQKGIFCSYFLLKISRFLERIRIEFTVLAFLGMYIVY